MSPYTSACSSSGRSSSSSSLLNAWSTSASPVENGSVCVMFVVHGTDPIWDPTDRRLDATQGSDQMVDVGLVPDQRRADLEDITFARR